jgi:hypothetical protein
MLLLLLLSGQRLVDAVAEAGIGKRLGMLSKGSRALGVANGQGAAAETSNL